MSDKKCDCCRAAVGGYHKDECVYIGQVLQGSAPSSAMNAASQRYIPDAECVKGKCAFTTSGCLVVCNLKRNPIVVNAASLDPDGKFALGMLAQAARMGASPAGLSLAVQLFGVGPCAACGFRQLHCRCAAPVGSGSDELAAHVHAVLYSSPEAADACALESLSRAKGSATSGEAAGIKTWQERVGASSPTAKVEHWAAAGAYIQDEINDLRAALAAKADQANAAPIPLGISHYQLNDGKVGGSYPAKAEQASTLDRAAAIIRRSDMGISVDVLDRTLPDGTKLFAAPVAERAAAPASVPEDPTDAMLDMLGRVHPFAMPRADNDRAKAYERLERAYVIQQPWPVPDQACVVWRADLMEMSHDLTHKQACFDSDREKVAAPEVAQPAAQGERAAPSGSINRDVLAKLVISYHDALPGQAALAALDAIVTHVQEWGASQRQEGRREELECQLARVRHLEVERDSALAGARAQHETNVCLVAENCALVEKLRARNSGSGIIAAGLAGLAKHVRAIPLYNHLLGDMDVVDKAISILATPAPTAGESSARPDGACNSALRAEPARQHDADVTGDAK